MSRTTSKNHIFDLEGSPVSEEHLQPWDLELFRFLDEVRIASSGQIASALNRSPRTTQTRLKKLSTGKPSQRWIERLRGVPAEHGNPDFNYSLCPRGAQLVAGARPRLEPQRKSGTQHVPHAVTTTEFLLRVRKACEASNGRVRFRPQAEILAGSNRSMRNLDKQLTLKAMVPDERHSEVKSTRPDGLFQLEFPHTRRRSAFFFETDMGKETGRYSDTALKNNVGRDQSSVFGKYQVYNAFQTTKGLCEAEFGFTHFYVLFFTAAGQPRVLNTIDNLQKIRPNYRDWWFSTTRNLFDDSSTENILGVDWVRGDGSPITMNNPSGKPNIATTPRDPHPVN